MESQPQNPEFKNNPENSGIILKTFILAIDPYALRNMNTCNTLCKLF